METKTTSIKKLIGILLAFVLTAGAILATAIFVSAAPGNQITSIKLALHYPKLGSIYKPQGVVRASLASLEEGHYTIDKAFWYNGGTPETNPGCGLVPDSFDNGKPYFVEFELKADEGYVFTTGMTIKIDGATVRSYAIQESGTRLRVVTDDITATQSFEYKGSDAFPVNIVISTWDKNGHALSERGGTVEADKTVVKRGESISLTVTPYYGFGYYEIDFGGGATPGFKTGLETSATLPNDFGVNDSCADFQIDVVFQEIEMEDLTVTESFNWTDKFWTLKWNAIAGADRYEIYEKSYVTSEDLCIAVVDWTGATEYSFAYPPEFLQGSALYEIYVVAVQDAAFSQVEELAFSNHVYLYKQSRLRYDLNGGGSGAPEAVTGREGFTVTVSSTKPVRNGYKFLGWSFNASATSPTYYGGETLPLSGDAVLYAVWESNGPVITKQPANTSATVGSVATFTIAATGQGTLKYQWQSRKNASSAWSNSGQPGAKTATLKVTAIAGLHGWQFRCIVTDGNGNPTESKPATLTVKPAITTQPKNTTATVGSQAIFTVAANGKATLKYQWQSRKNASSAWSNSGQPGAKTATLKVDTIAGLHGWQFRCIVTDGNGQKTESKEATLTVKPAITTQPKNTTATVGSKAIFTVAANGKATLKYQWQSRKNASSAWSNSGQPGAKTATLEVDTIAGLHGWQFRCIVTDGNGQKTESKEATLTVKPAITTQPKNTTAKAGITATFTVAANGKANLSYQWQSRKNASSAWSNSGQTGAKTATLQVDVIAGLNGWQFRCIVTDGNGQKNESNAATLTVK